MNEGVSKLLYIGAGLDVMPLYDFKNVKEFIFVDILPRSVERKIEIDNTFIKEQEYTYSVINFFMESYNVIDPFYYFSSLSFIQTIYYTFFPLPDYVNPMIIKYKNHITKQTIKYYISTKFPDDVSEELIKDIGECNALLIGKYIPSTQLLEMMNKSTKPLFIYFKKCFIGNYYKNLDDNDMLGYFIMKKIIHNNYFNEFILINDDNGHLIKTNDYAKLLTFVKSKLDISF